MILNRIKVTIMVPRNDALPLSMATSKYITQRLGFHIVVGNLPLAKFNRAKAGDKVRDLGALCLSLSRPCPIQMAVL